MSEFNKYSTDGGATFIDVEDSEAVHYGEQSKGYVGKNHLHVTQPSIFNLGGVKVTVNSDGSVTFNGTATSNNSFSLTDWTENLFSEGDYLLSDVNGQAGKIFTFIARKKGTSGVVDNTIDTHAMQNKPFTVDYTEYDYYKVAIYFFSGQTFNNLTIYPMIRFASIPDSTYEPWCMSNRELTEVQEITFLNDTTNSRFIKGYKVGRIVNICIKGSFPQNDTYPTLDTPIPDSWYPYESIAVSNYSAGQNTGTAFAMIDVDSKKIRISNVANVSYYNTTLSYISKG